MEPHHCASEARSASAKYGADPLPPIAASALTAASTFKDFVGSADTDDFYKFTLASTKPFTATLSGLSADANVGVGNHWWRTLAASDYTGHQLADPAGKYRKPRGW